MVLYFEIIPAIQTSPKITNKQTITDMMTVNQKETVTIKVTYSTSNPQPETKWIVEESHVDFKINEREDGISEFSAFNVDKDFTLEFKVWNSCGEDKVRVVVRVICELHEFTCKKLQCMKT